jgi:hypothetical protein
LSLLTVDKVCADKHFLEKELEKAKKDKSSSWVSLSIPKVNAVLGKVNDKCKAALEGSYGSFCELSEPILSLTDMDYLANYFCKMFPSVHSCISWLIGFEIWENNAQKQLQFLLSSKSLDEPHVEMMLVPRWISS